MALIAMLLPVEADPIGVASHRAQAATAVLTAAPAPNLARAEANGEAARDTLAAPPGLPTLSEDGKTGSAGRPGGSLLATLAAILSGACAGMLTFIAARRLGRRRRRAGELRQSAERWKRDYDLLQNALENIDDGLSVFDRHGRLVAWNARFAEVLDLPIALTTDMALLDLLRLQAQSGEFGAVDAESEAQARFDRFFRDLPCVRERVMRSGRVLRLCRRAMTDGGVVTVYADITELKAREREMVEARSQAEQANRTKSEFLANMSHELRTPLNAIIGFSEVISGEMLGPMQNATYLDYVHDIHSSGLHLLSIINDVLDMSKIEAGKLELVDEPVIVQQIVGEAIRMLHERAQARGIALTTEEPAEDISIRGDERALKQVMLNVLSNAIKFSHEGGRVIVRTTAPDPETLVVEIEDFGIGMDQTELVRALQPFGQAKAVITRTHGGTGLGLPITKGLVEAHGGRLAISSALDRGTLVRIELPRHAEPEAAPPRDIVSHAHV